MPSNDYEADATELLETYGQHLPLVPFYPSHLNCGIADFLMKYIIIGETLLLNKSKIAHILT